eukprot:TRINITY_DN49663_c0_g1_i2.p1 TRINITY_DN49663_c0_g1~~TRINITY_DN49663_c0_g1_i2.p1  ORF type:complete len:435 (-),score=126.76 TRINITY_DN49663_c0_g1_i2:178-1482(-)
MNKKQLLRFIKGKVETESDLEVVKSRDGVVKTLGQVFEELKLSAKNLTLDHLDMHADKGTYHRFDRFNMKYNPFGYSLLREIFMKTDNHIGGRYFAEILKGITNDLEDNKYQMAEYRVSVYGKSPDEWNKLAEWFTRHQVFSNKVRFLIQVPRLYSVYRGTGAVASFEELLKNLFEPLMKVTVDPSSNPALHYLLQQVVGFDSVDDESKMEAPISASVPTADRWTKPDNPPYSYYLYYMHVNILSLNELRKSQGASTFKFRPHCGEAGDFAHNVSAFMLANSINHGITLRKCPGIQYLYYLAQVGVAMSPTSNNTLFLPYTKNPFPNYFKQGLNVSLSTDDPVQFHHTREPLMEEYNMVGQFYKLSSGDHCELARNSVLQSGFEASVKAHWLGDKYASGVNDMTKTNVPPTRIEFRRDTLKDELHLITTLETEI